METTIYDAWRLGELDHAIHLKVMSPTWVRYCEIKMAFLKIKMVHDYNTALFITADIMNVSVGTVRRAISLVSKNRAQKFRKL